MTVLLNYVAVPVEIGLEQNSFPKAAGKFVQFDLLQCENDFGFLYFLCSIVCLFYTGCPTNK